MPHCKILAFRLKTTALCQEKIDLGPRQLDFEIHLCLFFKAFQFWEMKLRVSFLPGTVCVRGLPKGINPSHEVNLASVLGKNLLAHISNAKG